MTDQSRVDGRDSRQLLLWGYEGQKAINSCHIVVLGSDCVASEFLKNGALHGFANITIIDDAIVTEKDLRTNFLVQRQDIGKSRAEAVARLCLELNDNCNVKAINKSPTDLSFLSMDPKPTFVVTCGNLKTSFLKDLNDLCRKNNVYLLHIQSVGFFGALYVDAQLLSIFEGPSATQNPKEEIRAANPFEELVDYFNSFDFDHMNENELRHTPAPVVFYKAREAAAKKLNKSADTLRDEAVPQIREAIAEFGVPDGAGFVEAFNDIYSFVSPSVPFAALDIFAMLNSIGDVQTPFWQIARATKTFYDRHGALPHYGGCPDINTTTEFYKALKKVYETKAEKDKNEIKSILKEQGVTAIDESILSRFLKNVWRISAINYQPIDKYLNQKPVKDEDEYDISAVQVLFIALRSFVEKNGRQPENEADHHEIEAIAKELAGDTVDATELSNYLKQLFISKGEPIPSVVATVSAIAAQEVTKIIIQQSQPIKGFFIYNGIKGFGKTLW